MRAQVSLNVQLLVAIASLLAGCATPVADTTKAVPAAPPAPIASHVGTLPRPGTAIRPSASSPAGAALYRHMAWTDVPGWREDNVTEAWTAFVAGCAAIAAREIWRDACAAAAHITKPSAEDVRRYFEVHFVPFQVSSAEAGDEGLITGYYEPLLRGSRKLTARYRYPLHGVPDDLIAVELGNVYPELRNLRLRGRIEGGRVVPYFDRAQIESGQAPVHGKEIVWVDDAIELFFLQIQGSGRIALDSGETIRVGYADHNGYPYRSIGRLLVERGELTLDQASMQGIKRWALQNPAQVKQILNSNASYVFFRELPVSPAGPPGSLGVPLTPRRSIAVDPRHIPLGSPVFIATTWPNTTKTLNRLVFAQDTGNAIRGAVRADFFWGFGEAAAREAGRMKQRLRMWLLWPRDQPLPNGEASG